MKGRSNDPSHYEQMLYHRATSSVTSHVIMNIHSDLYINPALIIFYLCNFSDFDSDEWEQLAGSADDDDDDDDDDDKSTKKPKPKPQKVDNSGDKEDVVEDFVMSSDSE